ncbi:MAG: response regulator transcription factor [Pseudomonadota bacterium]
MATTDPIRVLLVDDHMVVRKGLVHVLNSADAIEVIGEAENGEEALYLCQKLRPDVVVMDVKMDGIGGLEAARLITEHHPSSRILALSTFADPQIVGAMMDAGAKGYLLKDVSAAELSDAVMRVHDGEVLLPDLSSFDSAGEVEPSEQASLGDLQSSLGGQQKKVLALMTKGFTNPEIAEQLGISTTTARYHVSAILRKLDVSNRSEAVAVAIRSDLVSSSDF